MQFKRAVLSDALKLYTEKLMLRTPLGARNDNGGTDCHSRLHGFAMTARLVILSDVASAAVKSCSRSKRITTFGHRKSDKRERIRNPL